MNKKRVTVTVAVAVAVVVLVLALVLVLRGSGAGDASAPFPPPRALVADSIKPGDFAGAESCASCHAEQYRAWTASTHGQAGGPPAGRVLREFDGTPIVFRDARVTPRRAGGQYIFDVDWDGEQRSFVVEGVIGRAHMVGGGTQAFVWRHPDGSLRLLPFELEGAAQRWFCNTETRANQGWAIITAEMSIADCGDWPPARVLGNSARYASCQQCHASQVTTAATDQQPLRTEVRSFAIDCESCHGPARAHAQAMRAGKQDLALRPLSTLRADDALEVCFRCHALKDDVRPGFLSGARLGEHFSLKLATLGSEETHVDGRTRTFAYQQGHLYSDCYRASGMTCGDCHDSHSPSYRDLAGLPLSDRFDDRQCTDCHPSKAPPATHTKHLAGSAASRCVTCHMPYQQQASVGKQIKYGRADHTIAIPRPRLDSALSITAVCVECHASKSLAQLDSDVKRLWGDIKPRRTVLDQIAAGINDRARLREIILADSSTGTMEFYDALARHLVALGMPNEPLDRKLRPRLQSLAGSDDDDVAALALATLHYAEGGRAATRQFLIERLRTLQARDAAVRARWAIALGHLGDRLRAQGRATAAVVTYLKVLEIMPNEGRAWSNLGLAYLDVQQVADARTAFTRATELDPTNSLAWVNLGMAHARAGGADMAADAYRRALSVNPHEALAHFNLGNIAFRAGDGARAQQHYQEAVKADPSLAPAHLNLARIHIGRNELAAARAALRKGLMFDRQNGEAMAALQQIEAQLKAR